MRRFRRTLIFCLATLCLVLALSVFVSLMREFGAGGANSENLRPTVMAEKRHYDWGNELAMRARRDGKLVFFTVGIGRKFDFYGRLEKILGNSFYTTCLEPDRYPADFRVLQSVFERGTGNSGSIEGGILSARLAPLYLTSNLAGDAARGVPSAAEAAKAAAGILRVAPEGLRAAEGNLAGLLAGEDGQKDYEYASDLLADGLDWKFESAKLEKFFGGDVSDSPVAVVTENARLAAGIFSAFPELKSAEDAEDKAREGLIKMFAEPRALVERLLIARALLEMPAKNGDGEDKLIRFADELLSMTKPDGRMMEDGRDAVTAENALAAQVLALAYSRFKRRAHLEGAERICGYIEFLLKTSYQLPSVSSVAVRSQSSARTYAFAGGAFADLHAATGENKYIILCRILFDELDGLFMSESGLWAINSHASALSGVARPIIYVDSRIPSYMGEAAQQLKYLSEADSRLCAAYSKKLKKISEGARRRYRFNDFEMASWKISQLPRVKKPVGGKTAARINSSARVAE